MTQVLMLGKNKRYQLKAAPLMAIKMAIQYCHGNDFVVNVRKSKEIVFGRHNETTGRLPDIVHKLSWNND